MIRLYLKYKKMPDYGEYETPDELRNAPRLDYLEVFEHIDTPDNDIVLKDFPIKNKSEHHFAHFRKPDFKMFFIVVAKFQNL